MLTFLFLRKLKWGPNCLCCVFVSCHTPRFDSAANILVFALYMLQTMLNFSQERSFFCQSHCIHLVTTIYAGEFTLSKPLRRCNISSSLSHAASQSHPFLLKLVLRWIPVSLPVIPRLVSLLAKSVLEKKKIIFILIVYGARLCARTCRCSRRPEEGAGVTGGREPTGTRERQEPNLGPFQGQHMLLTAEPALRPPPFPFVIIHFCKMSHGLKHLETKRPRNCVFAVCMGTR